MLVNQYKSSLLRSASFRKYRQFAFPPKNIRHWEEYRDGMFSDAIEGKLSNLGVNTILSPSMTTLNASPEPIYQPILDPNDC